MTRHSWKSGRCTRCSARLKIEKSRRWFSAGDGEWTKVTPKCEDSMAKKKSGRKSGRNGGHKAVRRNPRKKAAISLSAGNGSSPIMEFVDVGSTPLLSRVDARVYLGSISPEAFEDLIDGGKLAPIVESEEIFLKSDLDAFVEGLRRARDESAAKKSVAKPAEPTEVPVEPAEAALT